MAKLLKLRRGSTSQHGSFTGAEGEVTVDTDKDVLVVHDGSTAGGHPLAAQDMDNVPAGAILGTQLENSGVTAGQYGSSSAIPIVTVDAQGLVTAASTTAIDSTTIANGTSNVAVANNGNITVTRSGTARLVVDDAGVDVTGALTATGTLGCADITITDATPRLTFTDSGDNPDYIIQVNGGHFLIQDVTNGADKIKVNSDGHIDITPNTDFGAGIDVTGNITATGNVTTNGDIFVSSAYPRIHLTDTDNNSDYLFVNDNGNFRIFDVTNNTSRFTVESSGLTKVHGNLDALAGVDVTGNITVSGTVDGVDVATRDTLFGGLTSSSGVLTNGVTATTQSASDNTTKVATTAYVTTAIGNADAFPSGTKMIFQQTSAPTGWTKVTSSVDNKALRVVSGSAGSGGSNAFSNTFASRGINANSGNATQGGNVSVANSTAGGNVSVANASTGGNVNSHTLSTNEMPSHSHSYTLYTHTPRGERDGDAQQVRFVNNNQNSQNTGNAGGSGGHSHGFTGGSHNHNANFSGSAHNHNATFTGSAHNHSISVSNLDMGVQYLDVIIASKD